jgi:hypothetical protein
MLVLGIENGAYVGGRLENYVPPEAKDKGRYIEGILAKTLGVMDSAKKLSLSAADDPFALAIALETMKDALWDKD